MRVRRAVAFPLVVMAALLASIVSAAPAAAGSSERITDYRSEVTIETDGTIEVHETIDYDFGAVPHHGIYRDVPVRTDQSGKEGYDRVYPLDVVSVSGSPGTPAQYTVEDEGDATRIKIGDPDETITGEHTYDITYRVRGAMNGFPDHDELVWNAVGHRLVGADRAGNRGGACARRDPTGRVRDGTLRLDPAVRDGHGGSGPTPSSPWRSWRRIKG